MVGGYDFVFSVPTTIDPIDVVRSVSRVIWPYAAEERVVTTPCDDEWLIYRDAAAQALWEVRGESAETANSMLHVLCQAGTVTVVVDDRNHPEMEQMLNAIRDIFLRLWRCWRPTAADRPGLCVTAAEGVTSVSSDAAGGWLQVDFDGVSFACRGVSFERAVERSYDLLSGQEAYKCGRRSTLGFTEPQLDAARLSAVVDKFGDVSRVSSAVVAWSVQHPAGVDLVSGKWRYVVLAAYHPSRSLSFVGVPEEPDPAEAAVRESQDA